MVFLLVFIVYRSLDNCFLLPILAFIYPFILSFTYHLSPSLLYLSLKLSLIVLFFFFPILLSHSLCNPFFPLLPNSLLILFHFSLCTSDFHFFLFFFHHFLSLPNIFAYVSLPFYFFPLALIFLAAYLHENPQIIDTKSVRVCLFHLH